MTRVRMVAFVSLALATALGVVALGETTGFAQAPRRSKLDGILQRGVTGDVRVIIRTRPGGASALRKRFKNRGVVEHPFIGALTATVGPSDLSRFELDDSVLSVSLDLPVLAAAAAGAPAAMPVPKAPSDVDALLASLGLSSGGWTGKGVGVAFVDSGITPDKDFGPVTFVDFTSPLGLHPYDDYGHGTHVAGLIAGRSTVYPGVAPRARLVSLKVLDARGTATTSTVIDAIEFATTNRRALGIDVLNLSIGHPIVEPPDTDPLVQAVEAAVRAGIVVVVAAGNVGRNIRTGVPGYGGILSPGNAKSAITVGALDNRHTGARRDDTIPLYSSRGPTWYDAQPKPDVVAPGHDLASVAAPGSTLFVELPSHQIAEKKGAVQYFRLSGTSMSAATTTGVVALMIEAGRAVDPRPLKPAQIKEILEYSAIPLAGRDPLTQGHGAVNATGAIALAATVAQMPSRQTWTSARQLPQPVTVFGFELWRWAQTIVWGTDVIWGNGLSKPGWASNVVWSTSADDGDTVVWGTSKDGDTIVWGTCIDSGDTIVWGTSTGTSK